MNRVDVVCQVKEESNYSPSFSLCHTCVGRWQQSLLSAVSVVNWQDIAIVDLTAIVSNKSDFKIYIYHTFRMKDSAVMLQP